MSLAMKYAMKKRMAKGGKMMASGGAADSEKPKDDSPIGAVTDTIGGLFAKGGPVKCAHGMGPDCPKCYAEGGDIKGVHKPISGKGSERYPGISEAGEDYRDSAPGTGQKSRQSEEYLKKAKQKHYQVLGEMVSMKKPKLEAEGGFIEDEEASGYPSDLVERIMKQMYSEGGQVANDTPPTADFEDNDFDDLVLRDDLKEHYTGENSGDEDGNERTEEDEHDLVRRIMKSRALKDKMPRPA